MNKEDLVSYVATQARLTKKDAAGAVEAVLENILACLEKGETVKLAGFGAFEVKTHKERKGINPITKEVIDIPAMKAISFRAGKTAKERVNK